MEVEDLEVGEKGIEDGEIFVGGEGAFGFCFFSPLVYGHSNQMFPSIESSSKQPCWIMLCKICESFHGSNQRCLRRELILNPSTSIPLLDRRSHIP